MNGTLQNARKWVFGLTVVGSMVFGATQVMAAPSSSWCDPPHVWVGDACPTGLFCGEYCASGIGSCSEGCCFCLE